MRIVLWALQSPINIGMILRTAEVYGIPVTIVDAHGVLDDPSARETIGDFACGAFGRVPPQVCREPALADMSRRGRLIATAFAADAVALPDASFDASDHVLMGNEYDGLPDQVSRACDLRLRIPMPAGFLPKPPSHRPIDPDRQGGASNDGGPSLNVAVAASIIMSAAYVFLGRDALAGRGDVPGLGPRLKPSSR